MLFFFSLVPATIAVVIGYFVLFSSARAEGGIKRFGQVLSAWMFIQAGVVMLGGLLAPVMGVQSPFAEMGEHMQRMEQQNDKILEELRQGRPQDLRPHRRVSAKLLSRSRTVAENAAMRRNADENRRTQAVAKDGDVVEGAMSKPVKLILACLLCLGVIIGAVLLYEQIL